MKPVSFELSKELSDVAKEKGVQLPCSDFVYNIFKGSLLLCRVEDAIESDEHINSYTSDELLEWMPNTIQSELDEYEDFVVYQKTLWWDIQDGKWCASYWETDAGCEHYEESTIIADALCKLAIWGIKEGYINEH